MASLNDIETKIQRIIDKLSTKTVTGTLPLTFTTRTAGAASDWAIEGNAEGVGERTANLFDITKVAGDGITVDGSTFTKGSTGYWYDIFSHTAGSGTALVTSKSILLDAGTYYITATVQPSTTKFQCAWCDINGSNQTSIETGKVLPYSFTLTSKGYVSFRIDHGTPTVSNMMLVKGSTAPSTYVPFGYEIPISVNGTPQTFYIGDTPLTAGESISKTSTGVDIDLFEGENTVSTTLYNKPEMTIKYKYNGGN